MAKRHEFGAFVSESEIEALEDNPPPWLQQSRANRSATSRPVWVDLRCDICGFTMSARPKKWWPDFTYLSCADHDIWELPEPQGSLHRQEFDEIGGYFVGVLDSNQ